MGARLRLSRPAGLVLAAALLLALAAGCGDASDVAGCRQSCEALGLAPGSRPCETMCTGDCEELAETYGVEVATCEQLQAGEL